MTKIVFNPLSGKFDYTTQDYPYSISKEPTGFTSPENVVVSYDSTTRKITLTGTVSAYWQGTQISALTSGWVSDAHDATTGTWFLYYNGTAFVWSQLPWTFDMLQIAFVNYQSADKYALRECHGMMQWQSHQELHQTLGTYLVSGGDLSGYNLNSTTAADRRPAVAATVIADEDIQTTNTTLPTGTYTQFYISGTNTPNYVTTGTDIVPLSGNQPYYNLNTAGTWSQALMSVGYYQCIWLVAIPASADSNSQKYRYLWVQGQTQSLNLSDAQALTSANVSLDGLSGLLPEFSFIGKVIIRYIAGNWSIIQVNKLTGTRVSQTTTSTGLSTVTTDATLTGNGTAANPLHVAAVSTGATTLYVDTTLGTDAVGQGLSAGAGAVKTITYALSLIPAINTGSVVVNIAAGTYAESPTLQGKFYSGNYSITFLGSTSDSATQTLSSGVNGTSTTLTTLTITGAGWATNTHERKIIRFTSGTNNGAYRVVAKNTNDTLTLAGNALTAAPSAGDTFVFLSLDTIITGTFTLANEQIGVIFDRIKFQTLSTTATAITNFGGMTVSRCMFEGYRGINSAQNSFFTSSLGACSFLLKTANGYGVNAQLGYLEIGSSAIIKDATVTGSTFAGVSATRSAQLNVRDGCYIAGKTADLLTQGIRAVSQGKILIIGSNNFVEYCAVAATSGNLSTEGNGTITDATALKISNCTTNIKQVGFPIGPVSITTNTSLDGEYEIILVSGATTITLPTSVGKFGKQYTIKKTDSAATSVTINTTSSQTIDGLTTFSLTTQYQSITVISDNANWYII